ncbi:DUF6261 family protein [Bacteroidales bacterium OttesenSCG-928-C19]|nr:DUF6261 family protein [Bacteroidales bacterium OttesenSCG-928-C19]
MKILALALTRLKNNEIFRFLSEITQLAEAALVSRVSMSAMSDAILELVNILNDFLERLDKAIVALSKSEYTELVAEADNWRDSVYRGFVLYVQAFSHSFDDDEREAARRLQVLIDNYGDFRRNSLDDQSAIMDNFTQDLQSMHTENLTTIGATKWLTSMQDRNEDFKDVVESRHEEQVEQIREEVHMLRTQSGDVYREIVSLIEAGNRLSGGTAYVALINQINERVAHYKTVLATRKGVAEANKEK